MQVGFFLNLLLNKYILYFISTGKLDTKNTRLHNPLQNSYVENIKIHSQEKHINSERKY